MNAPATNFNVIIPGLRREDQTLVAAIDPLLDDADGAGLLQYQWQRSDGSGGWSDIAGATATYYTLDDPDVGHEVRLKVYFVDGGGTTEMAYSSPTEPVENINDTPSGLPSITGVLREDETVTADISALVDDDGLPSDPADYAYQWQRSEDGGQTWSDITAATDASYTLGDADAAQELRVKVVYTDEHGTTETIYSAAEAVENVNDAPVGFTVTITGDAIEETTLTATASVTSDDDGLPDPLTFTYQWQSSADGIEWVDIAGATSAEFTPDDAEVGQQFRAIANYEDLQGTLESGSSGSTAAIQAVNDATEGMVSLTSLSERSFEEFQVNTYTGNAQSFPYVTSLTEGGFVITWESDGQDGSKNGIYGQRYDANGSPEGDEFRVNTFTIGHQSRPSVTSLTDGGFVVTWESSAQDGPVFYGIYGQRYDATGTPEGDEFQVNTYTSNNQQVPSVTSLTDGGFVVAWESNGQDGSDWGIYGQRYDATGTPEGDEFQVNTYTSNDQRLPSVTSLTDGGFVVTWLSYGQDGSSSGVYGQSYDVTGTPVGDEFLVNAYTSNAQSVPSVTSLTDGGFVVTWTSYGQDGSNYGIYGQRYDATGTPEGDEFRVNTYTSNSQFGPAVTSLTDGGFVVTWQSYTQDGSSHGIYGQRYDANGSPEGDEFQVNTYTFSDQDSPSVTSLTDGGFVVTWHSKGQDGSDWGIYGQRFSATGEKQGLIFVANGDYIEGVPIKADTSLLSDPDGLGAFSYQWQRSEDGEETWSDIAGATNDQYLLTNDDALNQVRVEISYVDGQGFDNVVYSEASPTIENVNADPVDFTVTVSGDTTENATLSAEATVTSDGDGLPGPLEFAYQWQSSSDNGVSWADIEGATASTLALDDAQVDQQVRVVTSYTDAKGTVESVASVATAAVENVNDAPIDFTVAISGAKAEDQTLTAVVGAVADEDGVGDLTYQWQRTNEFGVLANITGATSSTYTLGDADVGTQVRVMVSYLDGHGTTETKSSGATFPIANVDDEADVTFTATGTAREGETLSISYNATDVDGAIVAQSHVWQASADGGASWVDASAINAATFEIPNDQSLVGKDLRVLVSTTDALGGTSEAAYTWEAIENVNDVPVNFTVTIAGDATEETTLTATASVSSDDDGLPDPLALTYQWQSSADGVEWANIDGATSAEFTPDDAEIGLQLRAVASYEDLKGTVESVSSGSTATVQAVNDAAEGLVNAISSVESAYDEFQVNTYTISDQHYPSVTSLTDGGFVVIWVSVGQDGFSYGIYGQRYDALGTSVGDEFQVNTYTAYSQWQPSVTSLIDGGFVVTWQSDGQDGSSYGIYGQRFGANGTPQGDEFRVNTYTSGLQSDPSVTSLTDGGFVVTWQSFQDSGASNYGIYGQRFGANGTPQGDEFRVNTYTNDWQTAPSVTSLNDGGFVVTWQSLGQDGSSYGIYGQRYDASGKPVGDEFQVNTYTDYHQTAPSASPLTNGGFVVVWVSRFQDGSGDGIYGQRFGADGTPQGDEFRANTHTIYDQSPSSVTALTNGGFVVTWMSDEQDGSRTGIYGQMYDAAGTPVEDEFQVNTYNFHLQMDPSVTSLNDGGFVITWASYGQDGNFFGVYGQRFSATGGTKSFIFDANANFIEGVAVKADTSLVSDPDGLGTFTYQWQRSEDQGQTWSNITGATNDQYLLTNDDALSQVRVAISYVDGQGFDNVVYSEASPTIENVNADPVDFTVTVSGDTTENATLSAEATVTSDGDGLPDPLEFAYQWQSSSDDGVSWADIEGATASTFELDDAQVDQQVRVVASYSDAKGTVESVTSVATAAVLNVNDLPTGTVTITGTATEDQTLTAVSTLEDEDGLGELSYLWLGNGVAIDGATASNLTLGQAQVGKEISVTVSYRDLQETDESVTSEATTAVLKVNDLPIGADLRLATEAGTSIVFSPQQFDYHDVETQNLAAIRIVSITGEGTLEHSTNGTWEVVAAGANVLAADLSDGALRFEPLSAEGFDVATITFKVGDGEGFSAEDYTLSIDVRPAAIVQGTAGTDMILGTAGSERIVAGDGDDDLNLSGGDDWMDGGTGYDVLNLGDVVLSGVFYDGARHLEFTPQGGDTVVGTVTEMAPGIFRLTDGTDTVQIENIEALVTADEAPVGVLIDVYSPLEGVTHVTGTPWLDKYMVDLASLLGTSGGDLTVLQGMGEAVLSTLQREGSETLATFREITVDGVDMVGLFAAGADTAILELEAIEAVDIYWEGTTLEILFAQQA